MVVLLVLAVSLSFWAGYVQRLREIRDQLWKEKSPADFRILLNSNTGVATVAVTIQVPIVDITVGGQFVLSREVISRLSEKARPERRPEVVQ